MAAIGVKEAVKAAKEHLLELYDDDPPTALALEEIERVQDGNRDLWAVTLGFHRNKSIKAVSAGGIAPLFQSGAAQVENRVYKTIFIDATTADFIKMDIRQVQ
jgi:hypothetical protein